MNVKIRHCTALVSNWPERTSTSDLHRIIWLHKTAICRIEISDSILANSDKKNTGKTLTIRRSSARWSEINRSTEERRSWDFARRRTCGTTIPTGGGIYGGRAVPLTTATGTRPVHADGNENPTGAAGTSDLGQLHTANPLLYSQIGQHGAKRRLRPNNFE